LPARPLRVLFLTQTYPRFPADTSGPFIRDLARGLVRGGDRVTVLAPHAPGLAARWQDGGVDVETFRYAPAALEGIGYSRSLDSDERIRPTAAVAAPLYLAAARRAAARAARRGFDLLHAHWIVPNGWAVAPLGRRLAVGYGLHGSDVFLAEKPLARSWTRRALGRGRFLTGCSPELVHRICALGFARERAAVIPYGVDTETFAPARERGSAWRRRLGIPDDATVVLSVGRMVTKKGYQVLLPALPELLQRHGGLHVVLAGSGDRLEEFRRAAAAWSDRVHLPGAVLRDTLPDLYRAADLFVLPAVHDAKGNVDGLPNVILEAMASGLPVVASGISGIPLAVGDGSEGLLVPEGQAEPLTGALETLLADPGRRSALGAAARAKAVRELTWEAVASRYRETYLEALEP
jgi:glycosyltransferase involved in cell wall biosynthesis